MTDPTSTASNELHFRVWTALAPRVVEARRDLDKVRSLLEPHRDAVVYGWREQDREVDLRLSHVFLSAGEATAHLALIGAPSRQFQDLDKPEIKPRRTKAAVRLGDHLGNDKFLDDLCIRLQSVTPYDPTTMPAAPDWLWVIEGYARYNLLAERGRIAVSARLVDQTPEARTWEPLADF